MKAVKSRANDDRGAIMVIAVFLAVFAIAILYTVVGTAETVLFSERLQDSADQAALSTAVMHARAMNLLVLINLVMAALLAVLVTVKLVESIAIVGIVVAGALAWPTGGASLSAVPPLRVVQAKMHTAYEDLEDPVYDALQTLHDVSDAVKETAPAVAFEMSESEIDLHHRPVVRAGAAFGSRLELPVEDAKFSELCGHAGELPLGLAQSALTDAKIPALPQLMGSLKKPMHSLTEKFSSWFCGDGGGDSSAAPTHKEKLRRSYPRVETESSRACEAGDGLSGAEGPVGEATSLACEKAQAEEAAGKPDDRTGACRAGTDCSIGGPYEKRVALAREQCDPTLSPKPVAYWYQARKGRVAYEWTGRMWKRGVPRYEQAVRRAGKDGQGEKKPPCGPLSVNPSVAPGYQLSPHPNGNVEEIAPVCSTEVAPPPAGFRLQSGTIEYREFTEVTHILGCVREMEETIPIEVGDRARDGGSSRAPKAVESRSHLGGESFQIRAVIEGNTRVMRSIEAVRLALWGKPVHEDPSQGELKPFVALAVAQAEYFYDAPDGRGAWMWNMKWRARLRRFRVPESAAQELVAACSRVGSGQSCASALTLARGSLFSH